MFDDINYSIDDIKIILAPQGAEYQAVCRGLRKVKGVKPKVVAIPMGFQPVMKFLQSWLIRNDTQKSPVLLMGLAGGLSPEFKVGDITFYGNCLFREGENVLSKKCDEYLTPILSRSVNGKVVTGFTSESLVWRGDEKLGLGNFYQAKVVDMEGFAVLSLLENVIILRVISDECGKDIPNLNSAMSSDGSLLPLKAGMAFITQPLAGFRLIRGAMVGLGVLESVTRCLFE